MANCGLISLFWPILVNSRGEQVIETVSIGISRKRTVATGYSSEPALNSPHRMAANAPIDAIGSGGKRRGAGCASMWFK